MQSTFQASWLWTVIGIMALTTDAVVAQVRPDATLGTESSRVRVDRVTGRDGVTRDSDVIEGGAQRSGNLFHSFEQFDVPEGRGAYFANPADVRNIFSRVTSADRSEINGTLGVFGDANLFFMNPNGILFGLNSSLDVGGSFVGTTANSIGFGELGFFSATNPEVPSQLLTVNPSAFLFNQIGNGAIVSQAGELDSAPGKSLLFLGGNVSLNGSALFSSGGQIEIGGLAGVGTVQLATGDVPQLKFSVGSSRSDVSLQNNSFIFTAAGGSIAVNAQNLNMSNSNIFSTLLDGQDGRSGDVKIDVAGSLSLDGSSVGQIGTRNSLGDTGNLIINTRSVQLSNRSAISNGSQRDAGDIRLTVSGQLRLDDSLINAVNPSGSTGSGSDTFINAQSINLTNQSSIGSTSIGEGAAGGVTLVAQDAIILSNSSIQSNANPLVAGMTSRASSGDVNIQARLLSLQEGSRISSSSFNAGRSGNIHIDTRDAITLNNGFIEANAIADAEAGGDVTLQTGQLSLSNYSQINAYTSESSGTGALGRGNAGNININAQSLLLTNAGSIYTSSVGSRGSAGNIIIRANDVEVTGFLQAEELASLGGTDPKLTSNGLLVSEINSGVTNNNFSNEVQGGTITIEANRLRLSNGGSITTDVQQARGRAGNIVVHATDLLEISGRARFNIPSGLSSSLQTDGIGRGGSIQVRTGQLNMSDASQIAAATTSQGDAGTVSVEASEVNLRGLNTRITTQVDDEARGNGGDLDIQAQRLRIQDNAEISTNTFGIGNAGNLTVNAGEIDLIDTPDSQNADTGLLTIAAKSATGNAGDLTINTDRLIVNNGAGVSSSTLGLGRAGNISIQANEQISLNGGGIASSVAAGATGAGGRLIIATPALYLRDNSNITTSTTGNGNAGSLAVNAPILFLQGDSKITTSTSGNGNAGNLTISAEQIDLQNANVNTAVAANGRGNAGNLAINTQQLRLRDDASVNSVSQGAGNAGNLIIKADQIDLQSGANISTQLDPGSQGRGGNLNIQTQQLRVRGNAQISTGTLGVGNAGNLYVRARNIELVDAPDPANNFTGLFTLIGEGGVGDAGDLRVSTDRLTIRNGASISSEVFGQGHGGDVRIRARDRINIVGIVPLLTGDFSRSGIFTGTNGQGDAGNISIHSNNGITLRHRGRISSASNAGSEGDAGDVNIQTSRLTILEGGSVLASVNSARQDAQGVALSGGQGRGGNVQIIASDGIRISGSDRNGLSSIVSTSTGRGATGRAGTITLTTDNLEIDHGGVVAARTLNNSSAGNIAINADTLTATNGGQVVTSTSGRGNAGRINLNIDDEVRFAGTDSSFADRIDRTKRYINRLNRGDRLSDFIVNQGAASGLFANTSANSRGDGGSINLQTTNLNLNNSARISARSNGSGTAGDIQINTENLNANDSTLETAATRSSGGTIQINPNDRTGRISLTNSNITTNSQDQGGNISLGAEQIRLRGDSDITTSSGGNGGNIDLTAASIIAFDDSDILANSSNARGGNITLDAPAFFGSGYVPNQTVTGELDSNNRVDVNASGSTASGTIQTPDTSFIQNSLSDLPANAIDSDQLLANSCIARTESGGTFLITGSGGLPESPDHRAASTYATGEVRSIPVEAAAQDDRSWHPGDAIIEPQGVYRLPDGRLVMSRECELQTN